MCSSQVLSPCNLNTSGHLILPLCATCADSPLPDTAAGVGQGSWVGGYRWLSSRKHSGDTQRGLFRSCGWDAPPLARVGAQSQQHPPGPLNSQEWKNDLRDESFSLTTAHTRKWPYCRSPQQLWNWRRCVDFNFGLFFCCYAIIRKTEQSNAFGKAGFEGNFQI